MLQALLQLTCDAVVELDADLRITSESSPQLASMFLRTSTLGVSFTDFVSTEERSRAAEILNSRLPAKTGSAHHGSHAVSAKAFHTRLVDSYSSKFRTEVFQVSYRKLDDQIWHLIGLREFTDQGLYPPWGLFVFLFI